MNCSSSEFGDLAREVLESGSRLRFRANGWSMHPAVRDGDILVVRPASEQDVKVGDLILATASDDRTVAHRVLRAERGEGRSRFFIKGDRCSGADGWLSGDEVLGKVELIERNGAAVWYEGRPSRLSGPLLASASGRNLWSHMWMRPIEWVLARQGSAGTFFGRGAA